MAGDDGVAGGYDAPFEVRLETRGYEIDTTATVPMAIIFRYCEHARWTMMRDPRLGIADLVHDGHFFVVREQIFEIVRRVGQGVPLVLRTWFQSAGRSTASVVHELLRPADGALVAHASVTGVWIGPSRRMVRLPDTFRELARAQAGAIPADVRTAVADRPPSHGRPASFFDPPEVVHGARGLDLRPPEELDEGAVVYRHEVVVPRRELDVFSHVNAATWLTYCDDARAAAADAGALPAALGALGYNVRTAILYRHEAVAGDRLVVSVARVPGDERALHFAACRQSEPGRSLCAIRIDTAPGARPISEALTSAA